ncbi:hypothetical protein SAY87_020241 [Trapa incisa]|uniref:RING-type E3 ubiquitin transferase n=1 Tax=Trapa incisa TaxID=236973 RepID=A0AAN7K188_9MYRT|nr:hypothetical protein SAY87_020241 [Trapa incisa]
MHLWSKGSIRQQDVHVETVVAIDLDKNSQWAVKWAAENLLRKNPNCVIIHVRTQNGHPNGTNFVPEGGRPPTEDEARQFFLPYRGFCARKGVVAKELILCGVDVHTVLIEYIRANSICHIVVGACSRNSLLRKFSAPDVGKTLIKSAPETCSVYIVGKDKLSTVRYAKKMPPAPTSDSVTQKRTIPSPLRPCPIQSTTPDTYDISRSSSSFGSPTSSVSSGLSMGKLVDFPSPFVWQKTGGSSPPWKMDSYVSKTSSSSSSSGFSNFSTPLSFQSSDLSAIPSSYMSGQSYTSQSNLEDEMEQLQLEFKQSYSSYNMACLEAAAGESKAREAKLQFLSSGEGRPPRRDFWCTSTEMEMMSLGNSNLIRREMTPNADEEMEGLGRHSETTPGKNIIAADKRSEPEPMPVINACYRKYTMQQIEEATDYFSDALKIGEGGYGPVYKATLDHTPVAIKALRSNISTGFVQFQREVEVLSCMRHPNMVMLVGACPEYGCLVYEYMDNGNLEERLFCKDATPPIPWPTRFKIAAEIGMGMAFLHQTKPEPMVHRDIKPCNILLDSNYSSKIGDVGLARLIPGSVADKVTQYHMTAAAGTFCYIDPEYQQTGILGVKSDVYSLGVLLLQLITARQPMGVAMQVENAIENGTFPRILDPNIRDWPVEEALSLAKLALRCCELRRRDRPDLSTEVLPELIRLRNLGQNTAV